MEVAQVWNHVPLSWHMHVDHTLVETTADLIQLASDKEEQLQASSADQIQRLIHVELQWAQAGRSQTSAKGKGLRLIELETKSRVRRWFQMNQGGGKR